MTTIALRLDVDGNLTELDLNQGRILSVLQRSVDGPVDCVGLRAGLDMWLSDEGMFDHPWNAYATNIARQVLGHMTQKIFGPVVFTGVDPDTGGATGLDVADAKYLQAMISEMHIFPPGTADILGRRRR